jgi:hypothetical protein
MPPGWGDVNRELCNFQPAQMSKAKVAQLRRPDVHDKGCFQGFLYKPIFLKIFRKWALTLRTPPNYIATTGGDVVLG